MGTALNFNRDFAPAIDKRECSICASKRWFGPKSSFGEHDLLFILPKSSFGGAYIRITENNNK